MFLNYLYIAELLKKKIQFKILIVNIYKISEQLNFRLLRFKKISKLKFLILREFHFYTIYNIYKI